MTSALRCLPIPALILCVTPSFGQEAPEEARWDGDFDAQAERRSGVALGVEVGAAAGNAVGYPLQLSKIDDPEFRATTDFAAGMDLQFWLAGALTDWLTVGPAFALTSVEGASVSARGQTYGLRLDTYPAYGLGGAFRDVAVTGYVGIAGSKLFDAEDVKVADGGSLSSIQVGACWEGLRLGHFAAGPELSLRHQFSRSMTYTLGLLGLRMTFYGGPKRSPANASAAGGGPRHWRSTSAG